MVFIVASGTSLFSINFLYAFYNKDQNQILYNASEIRSKIYKSYEHPLGKLRFPRWTAVAECPSKNNHPIMQAYRLIDSCLSTLLVA